MSWTFFNAIQSLQHRSLARTIDELVSAVEVAFKDLHHVVLDKTFVTLQTVMEETLKVGGDNCFTLPHSKKDKLSKEGKLKARLLCEEQMDRLSEVFNVSCSIGLSMNRDGISRVCDVINHIALDNDD
ncbi:hypothetical protein H310_14145 [Aphanomyces invadans]|uniref:Uncharacterized protein n=1 Tax=Aphanomyces invadans TaxID=157072 RepID=A0A024TDB1_9STRA|nr:hypothetical protein H310_14145 [Aphanomyces invadans]ETV91327.1 hypothetical protein H310_14145 [Aphanomyces invadans]|eukprot:XP_008880164.1 hypothetical protein H310_14145 [Aphanomyces invadans]